VAGNWKMHGTVAEAQRRAEAVARRAAALPTVELLVCPPFVHLPAVAAALAGTPVAWGAQDCAAFPDGAYTGEISAAMLCDLGCRYCLVGHSERRHLLRETDAEVAEKFFRALDGGLTPILCVGETLAEREAGTTEAVLRRQLAAVLARVPATEFGAVAIAYEPVWAIGTGRTATPEQAEAAHAFLRGEIAAAADAQVAAGVRLLYGGSVKAANAAGLFRQPNIDGGLVGGASLDAEEFQGIAAAAQI
jgi:triosephosphate isomerase